MGASRIETACEVLHVALVHTVWLDGPPARTSEIDPPLTQLFSCWVARMRHLTPFRHVRDSNRGEAESSDHLSLVTSHTRSSSY